MILHVLSSERHVLQESIHYILRAEIKLHDLSLIMARSDGCGVSETRMIVWLDDCWFLSVWCLVEEDICIGVSCLCVGILQNKKTYTFRKNWKWSLMKKYHHTPSLETNNKHSWRHLRKSIWSDLSLGLVSFWQLQSLPSLSPWYICCCSNWLLLQFFLFFHTLELNSKLATARTALHFSILLRPSADDLILQKARQTEPDEIKQKCSLGLEFKGPTSSQFRLGLTRALLIHLGLILKCDLRFTLKKNENRATNMCVSWLSFMIPPDHNVISASSSWPVPPVSLAVSVV